MGHYLPMSLFLAPRVTHEKRPCMGSVCVQTLIGLEGPKPDLVYNIHTHNNYIGVTSLCQKYSLVYNVQFLFQANAGRSGAFGFLPIIRGYFVCLIKAYLNM